VVDNNGNVNFAMYHSKENGDRYKEVIIKYLPTNWNIYAYGPKLPKMLSRDLAERKNLFIEDIYEHPVFQRKLSDEEIIYAERWLGFPFNLILEFCISTMGSVKKSGLRRKKELLAKYLMAWREFLTKNKIDVLSTNLNASLMDAIAVGTANKLNIPVRGVLGGRLENTMAIFDENFLPVSIKNNERAPTWALKEPPTKVLPFYTENPLQKTTKSKRPIPFISLIDSYLKYAKFYNSLCKEEKLKWRPPIVASYDKAVGIFRKKATMLLFDTPPGDEKYFLFPLHWSLDSQILWREYGLNQFELIGKISRSLPSGVYLHVRPHPHLMCEDVPIGKLLEMKKLHNVRFVSPRRDIYKTMKDASGIITINSTSGFEAIMHGFPVITVGRDFYAREGVCVVVRDYHELPDILFKIMENPQYGVDKRKRERFISEYINNIISIRSPIKPTGLELSDKDGAYIAKKLAEVVEEIVIKKGKG